VAIIALETVKVAMRVFLFAMIVAAESFRLDDGTFSLKKSEFFLKNKSLLSMPYPGFDEPIILRFNLFTLSELLVRIPAKEFEWDESGLAILELADGPNDFVKDGLASLCSTYFFFSALTAGGSTFC